MKQTLYAILFIAALFVIAASATSCRSTNHFDRMNKPHRCLVKHGVKHVKSKAINNCPVWVSKNK
jgi:hypothetical protein